MKRFLLSLSHLLLKAAFDEALRRALPAIYLRLDTEIPLLLSNRAPVSRIESLIASAITDALGQRAAPAQIDAVASLYDPRRAAFTISRLAR